MVETCGTLEGQCHNECWRATSEEMVCLVSVLQCGRISSNGRATPGGGGGGTHTGRSAVTDTGYRLAGTHLAGQDLRPGIECVHRLRASLSELRMITSRVRWSRCDSIVTCCSQEVVWHKIIYQHRQHM